MLGSFPPGFFQKLEMPLKRVSAPSRGLGGWHTSGLELILIRIMFGCFHKLEARFVGIF